MLDYLAIAVAALFFLGLMWIVRDQDADE